MPSKIRGGTKDKHAADMHLPRVSALGGGGAVPTTRVSDTFTDTDGVAIADHVVAPTNVPTGAWTAQGGQTWEIWNNRASAIGIVNLGHAIKECGVANGTVSGLVRDSAVSDDPVRDTGLVARWSDTSNYWFITINAIGDKFRIIERNATVNTVRATASVVLAQLTTAYTVLATLNGTTISATVDGGNGISYGSATLNQTATIHGIYARTGAASGAGSTVDNFEVIG